MLRAAELGSFAARCKVAAAIEALVTVAERRQSASPHLRVRHVAVLEQREGLLAIAGRLRRPPPIDVTVAAQLTVLVRNAAGSAYCGGRRPEDVGEITARCVRALDLRTANRG